MSLLFPLKKRQFFFFDEKETKSHWHNKRLWKRKTKKRSWFCRDTIQTSSRLGGWRRERRKDGSGRETVWDLIVNNDDISFNTFFRDWMRLMWNSCTRWIVKRESWWRDRLARVIWKREFKVREMSSISTLEVAWENYRCGRVSWRRNIFLLSKLLKRINSSCSSGRERRKSVSGMKGRLMGRTQGNLEMVKYCVANECPIDELACAYAARNGHLECLKYLREEAKAPWDSRTAYGRLKVVISTYSNILLSVSMINMSEMRVSLRPRMVTWTVWSTCTKPPKRRGTLRPY